MSFSFDEELATRFGLDEAILLQHFVFWIRRNRLEGTNLRDGKTWTYGSAEQLAGYFPFWTPKVIRRVLQSLLDQGLIITGNFNKSKYDRTIWYAFADEERYIGAISPIGQMSEEGKSIFPNGQMEVPGQADPIPPTGTPIPDTETDTKKDGNTSRADRAADVFAIVCNEKTGVPYLWQRHDFVHLQKLRKAFKIGPKDDPLNWEAAVLNYFASPLAKYSMADLCTRYSVFMNSPLNRYNKPTTHEALDSDIDRLQRKIRQEMEARRNVN